MPSHNHRIKAKAKKQSQMTHSIMQAELRYGVKLQEVQRIAKLIRIGHSKPVSRSSLRITKHVVSFNGVEFFVAYDTYRHTIATFLPRRSQELKASGIVLNKPAKEEHYDR